MPEQLETSQKERPPQNIPLSESLRKRKIHFAERFAEAAIKVTASFSIVLIFLIFVFVFREASSLFFSRESAAPAQTENPAPQSGSDNPESYGDPAELPGSTGTDSEPESYNPDAELPGSEADEAETLPEDEAWKSYVPNNDYPEIYNPETGRIPDIAMRKEGQTEAQTEAESDERSIWDKLFNDVWQPVSSQPKFGLLPLFFGTLKATFVAIMLGAPLGVLAAIYVALFARPRVREIVKPAIELLASFPSVVIGFFCMMVVATIVQDLFGTEYRLNAFVGGIGLSIAVIPIIFTITEDALSAIPKTLREASLALGATEWETAFKVTVPAATPGIFAAILLGFGRAFGETMVALMATGNAALANLKIFEPARTFAATIGAEMGEVVWGSEHYGILFFLGVLLFVFSFVMNAVTEFYIKQRLLKKFQGS